MQKDSNIYLKDMLKSIEKIEYYVKDCSYGNFTSNNMLSDAVVRNLEIIGEAAKNIPSEIKRKNPQIEWKKISGLRDILIHAYFGINLEIIWDIVSNKLPQLKNGIREIISKNIIQK